MKPLHSAVWLICPLVVFACSETDHTAADLETHRTQSSALTPPLVDLNGNIVGFDYTTGFVEGNSVVISAPGATVSDDLNTITLLTATITNVKPNDVLDANVAGNITKSFAGGVLTLSGADTVGTYQAVMRTITFTNTSDDPDPTLRVINVTATDDENMTDSASTTVTITTINDAPSLNNQTFNVDENSANGTTVGVVVASDPEGDNVAYSIVSGNTNGAFAIDPATGLITVNNEGELNHEDTESYAVGVEATDDGLPAETTQATVVININNVNETPVHSLPIDPQTSRNTPLDFNNGFTVTDEDSGDDDLEMSLSCTRGRLTLGSTQGLSFTVGTGTSDSEMTFTGSLASMNAALNGLLFQPDADTAGAASIRIRTNDLGHNGDGDALEDDDTVTVFVKPAISVSDATVIEGDNGTANLNFTLTLTETVGQTVSVDFAAEDGTATLAGSDYFATTGTATFAPAVTSVIATVRVIGDRLDESDETITLRLSDATQGDISIGTAVGTIADDDSTPIAQDAALTLNEDTNATSNLVVADDDGDNLSYAIVTNPTKGTLDLNNSTGQFTYTPAENVNGADSFTFRGSDGPNTSNTATVDITIVPQNDAPVFQPQGDQLVAEEQPLAFTMSALDVDGDTISYALVNPPDLGSFAFDTVSGVFTWTPSYDEVSSQQGQTIVRFFFLANDGNSGIGQGFVDVTIQNTNRAPVIDTFAGDSTGDEGETFSYTAAASDADGQTLTYSWNFGDGADPVSGAGLTSVTHRYVDSGPFTLTLTVSDSETTVEGTLAVTVDNVAPLPNAGADKGDEEEGTPVALTGTAQDPGADTLTYTWDFGDGSDPVTGDDPTTSHTYVDNGIFTATFTASDGEDQASDTTIITVANAAPAVQAGDAISGVEGSPVSFDGAFSDSGTADTHTISWDLGDGTTVTGNLAPTHTFAGDGTYTAALTVTDNDGDQGTGTVIVTIQNVPPSVNAGIDQSTEEGQSVQFAGTATDPGDDTLTFQWDFGDGNSASEEAPSHTYLVPGTYVVTFDVNDGSTSVADTMVVTVAPVAPAVDPIQHHAVTDEGTEVVFTTSATEPGTEDTALVYEWAFGDGSLATGAGLNTVAHTYADQGDFSVALTVTDTDGDQTSVTSAIQVNNVAPQDLDFGGDRIAVEHETLTFTATATDPGDDTLSYAWAFGVDGAVGAGQTVTYAYGEQGVYTVTLTVSDEDGGSSQLQQTVSVANVAPVVDLGENRNVAQGEQSTFTSTVVDLGANEDLFYEWDVACDTNVYPACDQSFSFIGDRQGFDLSDVDLTFTQVAEFTLTLQVTDKDGDSGEDSITVTVANEPPSVALSANRTGILEGESVEFAGAVSDRSEQPLIASLNFDDGTVEADISVSFPYPNIVRLHTYTQEGNYQAHLTATDNDGEVADDTVVVTVSNVPPTVTLPAQSGSEGAPISLVAGATDPGDDVLTYAWNFGDNTAQVQTDVPTLNHTYAQDGLYTLSLAVFDGTDTTIETATITVANIVPSVLVPPIFSGAEEVPLTFEAQVADPGADTLTFTWRFGDGTADATTAEPTISHTYAEDGTYALTLTVDDGGGQAVVNSSVVNIANLPPEVSAGLDDSVAEGTAYPFTGSATDVAADTLVYCWRFGDGTPEVCEQSPRHTFADDGEYAVTLTVTDDDGGEGTDMVRITVTNVAPTADAGPDLDGAEGSAIQFDGTATDAGNDELISCWDFGDGSDVVCEDDPTHTYTQEGQYTVTLTVTDDDGGRGSDALVVDIANTRPMVDAGPDVTLPEGGTVAFTGTAVDPSDDVLTYCWSFGDGTPEVCEQSPEHTYAQDGAFTATLRVDDGTDESRDTVLVTVQNVAPAVSAGEDVTTDEGSSVTFEGTVTDPGDDTLTYSWDFGDNTPVVSGTLNVDHTFADDGTFTVTLTVMDDDVEVRDTLVVTVANLAPMLVDAGRDETVLEGATVTFQGSASDPGEDELTFTWDFGDGSDPVSLAGLTNPRHQFTDDPEGEIDTYTVTLTVTDGEGGSAQDTATITVLNVNPIVDAGEDVVANEGDFVNFTATASDVGDDVLTYRWTFGDGTPSVEGVDLANPTHQYTQDGSYTVLLEVTDDDGGTTVDLVAVNLENLAPRLIVTSEIQTEEGTLITFDIVGVDPGDDQLLFTLDPGDGADPVQHSDPARLQHAYRDNGVYQATVTVDDQDGGVDVGTIQVQVANVAPSIVSDPVVFTTREAPYSYAVIVEDQGADDVIEYTVIQGPVGMQFVSNVLRWSPDIFQGSVAVAIRVSDDDSGTDTQSFTLTVGFIDVDNDGAPDSCELAYGFDPEDPNDGDTDPDNDCLTVAQECLLGRNPREPELPTAPSVHRPLDDALVEENPVNLTINNATDPLRRPLVYSFELFSNRELTEIVEIQEGIEQGDPRTLAIVASDLIEDMDYWWRATAYADNCAGEMSTASRFRFSLQNNAPGVPVPVAPTSRINTPRPVFEIANATDPEGEVLFYDFEVHDDEETLVASGTGIPAGNPTTLWEDLPFDLTEDASYTWRARARDIRDLASPWCDPLAFRINREGTPPGTPVIWYPAPNQVITDVTADLFVVASEAEDIDGDTLTYDFVLAENESLTRIVMAVLDVEPGSGEVKAELNEVLLEDDSRYWIGVTAKDTFSVGVTAKTSIFFSLGNGAPTDFSPVAPLTEGPGVTSVIPSFVWRNTTDPEDSVVTYELEVYADADLTTLVTRAGDIRTQVGDQTSWARAAFSDNTAYWWRVRALDDQRAASSWTEVQRFFVNVRNDPPTAPVPLDPAVGDVLEDWSTVTLTWENGLDADGDTVVYSVEVFDDSGNRIVRLTDITAAPDTDGTTGVRVATLSPGSFDWRVMASDHTGASAWSSSTPFRIRHQAPEVEETDAGVEGDAATPTARYPKPTGSCTATRAKATPWKVLRMLIRR
jgi:PKD repeat protein